MTEATNALRPSLQHQSAAAVFHAECLEFMGQQTSASFDLVFCSPPYEAARTYGINFALKGQDWVDWAVERFLECLRVCKGLVAWVVEGQTRQFRWSAAPALLMADLHRCGVHLRKPPAFKRVGIPGSGGPDWLRNDYEFIVCATNGGKLPWSDNTAMGHPPKYEPGGQISHRKVNGERVNAIDASVNVRNRPGPHWARVANRRAGGKDYTPPEFANPGNVIDCGAVGGGNMGCELCHENEAPFPEGLAEFFVRSFCPPGGIVFDPFAGSGTTLAVAIRCGRQAIGCDIRESQVTLARKRLGNVTPELFV